jgi:phenylpyruvate tautomerase PptA (4-oxalocrotonate tautomerase family)
VPSSVGMKPLALSAIFSNVASTTASLPQRAARGVAAEITEAFAKMITCRGESRRIAVAEIKASAI